MNWLADTLTSSIGKKLLMALTGFSFILFLTMHLAGNLTLLGGRSMFNAYADRLHELGLVLVASEYGLLFLAIVHIVVGLSLFYHNFKARPVRYHVNKSAGGRTIGSATMPYTGILMLVFIVVHLMNFSFVDKSQTTIYDIVLKCLFQSGLCDRVRYGHDIGRRACQPWFVERISNHRGQSSQIHAGNPNLEHCFRPDGRHRFRHAAHYHFDQRIMH
jgi:succinate dehydrogenase/fumarate reductase cytochrome b subunit